MKKPNAANTNNTNTLRNLFWLAVAAIVSVPQSVLAQQPQSSCNSSTQICNPIQQSSLTTLINQFVNVVLQLGVVVAVLFFVYAGFKYITAQGDSKKIEEAHKVFINTALGTAVLLGAKLIAAAIQGTISGL